MRECAVWRWLMGAILVLLCGPGLAWGADVQLSGYYKNLFVESRTWAGEPFVLDVNRLRLAAKGQLAQQVGFDLQYDNEALLGDYLKTVQFQQSKELPPP